MRIANCFIALALLVPQCMQPLNAQGYPEKTIRLIVPYSPGGTADMLARTISQTMAESLGQQIIIDNRPGAGGNIGADLVAKAAPDGYTLLMGTVATHAINPHLYPDLPYDAAKDFAPIILLATLPNLLVVNSSLAAKDVKDLIALAKSKPGELAFASAGNGTSQHLSGELFKKMTGVDMTHIPYKGSAPAVTDLIGGQVQLMFDNIPSSLPHVRAGKLRALAVTGPRRSPVLPDLPTLSEAGLPGFSITSWFALLAPARTPAKILLRLNKEAEKAIGSKELRRKWMAQGIEPAGGTSEQLAAFMRTEAPKWEKIVRRSGARVE
ncbi:MAG TPA: tripartite tricarboxylate transporter substrate binding protein [Burkholderiales bacterium]|nr:tripartite tricarboxylate transporter substrate binding protein [Burkholderiales bacterium]